MLQFKWFTFDELSLYQLYDILKLRSQVFVVEQICAYQDVDGVDFQAHHLLGSQNEDLVAYLRLFSPHQENQEVVFGRLVIAKQYRKFGYGKKLMNALLVYCEKHFPNVPISCEAQSYLQRFYEDFGFKTISETFDLDGIPHIHMRKDP